MSVIINGSGDAVHIGKALEKKSLAYREIGWWEIQCRQKSKSSCPLDFIRLLLLLHSSYLLSQERIVFITQGGKIGCRHFEGWMYSVNDGISRKITEPSSIPEDSSYSSSMDNRNRLIPNKWVPLVETNSNYNNNRSVDEVYAADDGRVKDSCGQSRFLLRCRCGACRDAPVRQCSYLKLRGMVVQSTHLKRPLPLTLVGKVTGWSWISFKRGDQKLEDNATDDLESKQNSKTSFLNLLLWLHLM